MIDHKDVQLTMRARLVTLGTLPAARVWENMDYTPTTGVKYVEEFYLRGPAELKSFPLGRVEAQPQYLVRVNVPADTGLNDVHQHVNDILALFPPALELALGGGGKLTVRGKPAPYGGQLLQTKPGFAGVLVTIPLECSAYNSI